MGCLSKLWGVEKTIDLCLDTCILRLTTKTNLLFGGSAHDCHFPFATDSSNKKIKCAVSFSAALHSYHTGTETPQCKTRPECQADLGCCCRLAVRGNALCGQTSLCCLTCLGHYSLPFSLQLPDPSDWNQNTRQQQWSLVTANAADELTPFRGKTVPPTLPLRLSLKHKTLKAASDIRPIEYLAPREYF